jgi:hypothetical protein
MKPNSNKPKTGWRRFRGLEVAQAALLLVLGVVVAMAMYFVAMGAIQSAPLPIVQLDPYASSTYNIGGGDVAILFLKFAKTVEVAEVRILSSTNFSPLTGLCLIHDGNGWVNLPMQAIAGRQYMFLCQRVAGNWEPKMLVYVKLSDGESYVIPWIRG